MKTPGPALCVGMLACFVLTLVGTCVTFFLLALPVLAIGLPLSLLGRSQAMKCLAISAVMGPTVYIIAFLAYDCLSA